LPLISTAFNLFNISLSLSQPDAYIHSLLARAYNHPTSLKIKLARGFIRRLSQHPSDDIAKTCTPPVCDSKEARSGSVTLRFRLLPKELDDRLTIALKGQFFLLHFIQYILAIHSPSNPTGINSSRYLPLIFKSIQPKGLYR
jgi:hypothetical protein